MRTVIIGGGPSGIVTLKTLLSSAAISGAEHTQVEAILLEAEDQLGGTFRYRGYENAELVSSRQLTAFSDFRIPRSDVGPGDHVSLPAYIDYLERYSDHFELRAKREIQWDGQPGRIRTGCKVVRLERTGSGHRVTYVKRKQQGNLHDDAGKLWEAQEHTLECDALAVCSGLHVTPSIPVIPGIEHVKGEKLHSSQYKARSQLAGKKVLILGVGETAMDIGYESIRAGAESAVMCTRSGFLSFPKVLNDFEVFGSTFDGQLPIDGLITNLMETAYVHPWVKATHLRWHFSDMIIKRVLFVLTGTQAGCAQWAGSLPPDRLGRAYVNLNKSSKAMPYLMRPFKPAKRRMDAIARYIDPPEAAQSDKIIDLAPWPDHIQEDGRVIFGNSRDGYPEAKRMKDPTRIVKPDLVIYATGYTQEWAWAGDYARPQDTAIDVMDCFASSDPTCAFIGLVRPGVGAIPPIAEVQAMMWAAVLQGVARPKPTSPHYRLIAKKGARIQYGVDYSSYMHGCADVMGAAPSLWPLLCEHGLQVFFIYCFGAAFVSFYRLTGPFKSDRAPIVAKDELYETIQRRGLLGNAFMGLIPMIFYAFVNLSALILETLWLSFSTPIRICMPRSTLQKLHAA
ncbi:uncharacterized protein L969DRAFT_86202 [Mixia osmundae IAM 14324]|uniref:Dimethylaniline monooxygenase n=1 Tax=Mixia osmundae (strain CBS 9802 / IAM 14324 / JCM 22182 / KY 12970) TaxID=764103 RepID=G7DU31_MIXOS|nr:uncharacterized protein L969DRAFT_86202 [Mixia osmundae IAM 14324]KEI40958.1 hypothetical protein L969DRAFT_86202 [Mixia osmundae IAM 14324]GAA94091.1 hypothetical protein E5Q_00738 [Mixia osmundae IAM 14324]